MAVLLVRLQGSRVPERATVKACTFTAGLTDAPSMEQPNKIQPIETNLPFALDLTIDLPPYAVSVVEVVADR